MSAEYKLNNVKKGKQLRRANSSRKSQKSGELEHMSLVQFEGIQRTKITRKEKDTDIAMGNNKYIF